MGGAAGLAISHWGVSLLKSVSPAELPVAATVGIDYRALVFTLTISGLVSFCLSLAPALTMLQSNTNLRGPRRKRRMADILVAAEVALALVLLAGCGLLAKSLLRLRQIDPGVRVDHVLTMRIQLSGSSYQNARQRVRYFSELEDRLAKLPGVVSVSEVDRLPVFKVGEDTRGGNPFSTGIHPWNPNAAKQQMAHTVTIGTGYFRTMQIPLRQGRDFSQSDNLEAPPVAIVNETLARRFFPENHAMGQRILFGAPEPGAHWMTVIGIIGDVRTGALDLPPPPQFYMPHAQDASGRMFVVIRTAGDPRGMSRIALATARELDPEQPVYEMSSMEQHVEGTMGQPRFRAMLVSFFALAALFLAAVGIYGVVTTATVQKTKEIGIRVALGADTARIVATILAHGLQPVALGMAIGIAGTLILARLLSSVLYAVKPDDPATFAWAVLLLGAIATAACLAPAMRAARLDPLVALREE